MRLKESEENQEIGTKFDGTNYSEWSSQIKFRLMEKGLWNHVTQEPLKRKEAEADADFKKRVTVAMKLDDQKALGIIGRSIKADFIESIGMAETACQAWKSLQQIYESNSAGSLMTCRSEFYNLRMDEKEDLVSYLGKLERIQRLCKKSKAPINDEELIVKVVHSLPKSFDSFCQGLRSNRNLLESYILIKEQLLSEWQARSAGQMSKMEEKKAFKTEKKPKFQGKCFNCDKTGHKKSECWAKGGDKEGKGPKAQKEAAKAEKEEDKKGKVAFFTQICHDKSYANVVAGKSALGTEKLMDDHCWIVDSGATDHMSRSGKHLDQVKSIKENVRVADDTVITTQGVGSLECSGHDGQELVMKQVWHVPGLGRNLLSVASIDKAGHIVQFGNGQVEIKKKDGSVLARGNLNRDSGLYVMKLDPTSKKESKKLSSYYADVNLWHQRLGHLNFRDLKNAEIKICGDEKFCDSCAEGKMARLPFSKEKSKDIEYLECLNLDLMGPMETRGIQGEKYVLLISDEGSGYTVAETMNSKDSDQVLQCTKDFIALMERQTCFKVKKIKCDGGGEFINNEMIKYCAENGIILDSSNPYTPQQNGVAERKNRTIMEMARSMLSVAKLPNTFWPEAVLTAAFIRNRCPQKYKETPMEKLLAKKPDYKFMKVFGCHCYVHVPKELRKKLDPKAELCIFVGYSSNGYRMFNLKKQKFIWSRDVIFNETRFGINGDNRGGDIAWDELDAEQEADGDLDAGDGDQDWKDDENENPEPEAEEGQRRVTRSMARSANAELQAYVASGSMHLEPKSFKEAQECADADGWRLAMDDEIQSLNENETWELCKLPQGKKEIGSKWVYRVKVDERGNKVKLKARLVIQGYRQRYGFDYTETFAPVLRLESLRVLLALKAIHKWRTFQLDVKTAFLYGDLEEEIYMTQPEGYQIPGSEGLVCKLKKSLYGLKQAPRIWNLEITTTLKDLGFKQARSDNGVFILDSDQRFIILGLWVDDIPGFYKKEDDRIWLIEALKTKYKISDEGQLKYILGVLVEEKGEQDVAISQVGYIEDKCREFGLEDAHSEHIPMTAGADFSKSAAAGSGTPYREIVGSLMHVMVNTRPDIAYALSVLSRNLENPTQGHWEASKRVLKYLKTTKDLELKYTGKGTLELEAFVDSSDGGGSDGLEKPTFGYVIKLAGGAVVWKSKKLERGTLSVAESEFLGLTQAVQDVEWIRELLTELGQDMTKPTKVWEDNQSCIKIARNPVNQGRTKHLGRRVGFVRDALEFGIIDLEHLSSEEMTADIFTKALSRQKLEKFRARLGLWHSSGSVEYELPSLP